MNIGERNDLLTPAEVAVLFRVNTKTVTRWARAGKLATVRTLGGHRRFRREDVEAQLSGGPAAFRVGRGQTERMDHEADVGR